MRLKFFLSLLAVALLVVSCILPWMTIESKAISINGINTEPTRFGKPGYFHFIWAGLYLLSLLINKLWAKRTAIVFAAFNIAWALRNFLLLPVCSGGECPVKETGLYLLIVSSILMFVAILLPEDTSANH